MGFLPTTGFHLVPQSAVSYDPEITQYERDRRWRGAARHNFQRIERSRQRSRCPADAAPTGFASSEIEGAPGLTLRVLPSGKKSWIVWTKTPSGKWRKFGLGSYPATGLAKAKDETLRLRRATLDGVDPFQQRNVGTGGTTLRQLGERFVERHSKPKKKSWKEDQRILSVYFASLAGVHADRVTRSGIVDVLDGVVDNHGPIMANRALATIRKCYAWGVAEGHVAANPAAGIPARAKETPRTRLLSDTEIHQFWRGLDGPGFDECTAAVLRLLLLTGARLSEATGMVRTELDLDSAPPTWTLLASRNKSGRSMCRPLAPVALSIVKDRLDSTEGSYVFSSPFGQDQPIGRAAPWRAISRAAARGLVPVFSPHDLRRTVRTGLARLGVAETVVKKLLGHVPPKTDVTASVYDQHAYIDEMLAALKAWERILLEITC